jgi:hypothetical protein
VEEENVKLYQHQLDDTNNQFQTGTVSNFEVLRQGVPRERPAEPDHGAQQLPDRDRAAAPVARDARIRALPGGRRAT